MVKKLIHLGSLTLVFTFMAACGNLGSDLNTSENLYTADFEWQMVYEDDLSEGQLSTQQSGAACKSSLRGTKSRPTGKATLSTRCNYPIISGFHTVSLENTDNGAKDDTTKFAVSGRSYFPSATASVLIDFNTDSICADGTGQVKLKTPRGTVSGFFSAPEDCF